MNQPNPILEDYNLLMVFRNIGLKLLQQVRTVMMLQPYNSFFKPALPTEQNEFSFTYLEHLFKTQIEVFFNHSKMPRSAFIATYYLHPGSKEPEEIISYAFDLDYNINDIYTFEDFADHYLVEFHQNLKKSFSDNHMPFSIKLKSK